MPLTQVQSGILADSTQTYGMKNRIINGDMRIDQRNAGAAVTTNLAYTVDRFSNQITYGSLSFQQSSTAPVGFKNSLAVTVTSGGTVSASDRNAFAQWIEGYNMADLDFGTANAKTVTLSFWVRSSLTGTFSGCLSNAVIDRSFVFTYTINSANTWEQKTVTITGETSGTWQSTNAQGLRVAFDLGTGTDRLTSTTNAWQNADNRGATGAVRLSNTTGATWFVTGVQLEVGSTATQFDRRPFGAELTLCYRYYQQFNADAAFTTFITGVLAGSTTNGNGAKPLLTTMRTTPSLSISAASTFQWGDATNNIACTATSYAPSQSSTQIAHVNFSASSGLTQYRPYYIMANNTTSAFLGFSAEL